MGSDHRISQCPTLPSTLYHLAWYPLLIEIDSLIKMLVPSRSGSVSRNSPPPPHIPHQTPTFSNCTFLSSKGRIHLRILIRGRRNSPPPCGAPGKQQERHRIGPQDMARFPAHRPGAASELHARVRACVPRGTGLPGGLLVPEDRSSPGGGGLPGRPQDRPC